ncbi:MAG: response regulator [bacterium]
MEEPSVLVVEDDEELRDLYGELLELEGMDVYDSPDGSSGVEIALDQRPDCILLDVDLPDMSGFDVLEEVHATEEIPVLFITGMDDPEIVNRAFEAGGMGYVSKPVQKEELLARIRHIVELNQYETQLEQLVKKRTEEIKKKNQALEEMIDRLERRVQQTHDELYEKFDKHVISVLNRMLPRLDSKQVDRVETIKQKIKQILKQEENVSGSSGAFKKLTNRELEIADYVRDGFSSKEIAKLIGRSTNTIKNHRANIREKLGLKNTGEPLQDFLNEHM